MNRYDNLELDLDCDGGGGVEHKAALFGGMFKRSSKYVDPSVQTQDNLSASGELSKSNDSLNDNNGKEKGGGLKGMFKKTTKSAKEAPPQVTMSLKDPELSVSSDSLSDKSSKSKPGILKVSHKPGHVRRPSQDLLDSDLLGSKGSLPENTKESGGMFGGMFKKSPKPIRARTQSREDLFASKELSGSDDNLSATGNTKESGGIFSGMFKKPHKAFGARTQSQEDLTAPNESSGSNDNLSATGNTKESSGIFSGMFKKPHKARTQSQEDLTAPSESSGSNDNLSATGNTKESGGMFGGIFKKSPKRTPSQDDLSAPDELSGSHENLAENNSKEKGGLLSGVFKKKVARSQSQDNLCLDVELSGSSDSLTEKSSKGGAVAKILKNPFTSSSHQEKEKAEHSGDSQEKTSSTEKPKVKQNGFSAMMKSTFYTDKQEKNRDTDDEELLDKGEEQSSHKQNKFSEAMTKLNPFRTANKSEKLASSDDDDPPASSEKSSGNKLEETSPFKKVETPICFYSQRTLPLPVDAVLHHSMCVGMRGIV